MFSWGSEPDTSATSLLGNAAKYCFKAQEWIWCKSYRMERKQADFRRLLRAQSPRAGSCAAAADFEPPGSRTTLLSFAKITINYESIDNFIKKQQRRPRGPRQLSKQEITQDLKYGISAKGSSDPGLTQVVNNVQKHRNLKSHYPLSFPREKGLELPDDIFLRWQNRNISLLLMLGLAQSINNSTSRSKLLLNRCRWARPKLKAKSHKLFHTSTAVHRCKFCTDFLFFLKLNIS